MTLAQIGSGIVSMPHRPEHASEALSHADEFLASLDALMPPVQRMVANEFLGNLAHRSDFPATEHLMSSYTHEMRKQEES